MREWLARLPAHLKALLAGGILFVLAALLPPWKQVCRISNYGSKSAGYSPVFWPPKPNRAAWSTNPSEVTISVEIDSMRLLVEWAIVLGATVTAFVLLRKEPESRSRSK